MIESKPDEIFSESPVEPLKEMGAYEALWRNNGATFKTVAELFYNNQGRLPSELVATSEVDQASKEVLGAFERAGIEDFGVTIHGTANYPEKLRDARYPIEFFYYQGNSEFAFSHKSVAVVGSRKPSTEGLLRTRRLVRLLVENDFTIFSGLAQGVDTQAHHAALAEGGRTVAVLGTPLTESYPKENRALQNHLAAEHLIISQVPVLRYSQQNFRWNRLFFPERNATMSALADATVIVEAGETSGTLTQARAALYQGRKLFILDSCFLNPNITWPERFQRQGAIRVKDLEDILKALRYE